MKSSYELCYDRFVLSNLCYMSVTAGERVPLLLEFLNKRESYYELLCDLLYGQAIGKAPGQALWLTPYGEPYLSSESKSLADTCLIPVDSSPPLMDDMSEHLQLMCKAMLGSKRID